MFQWAELNEAQKKEKKEDVDRYKEEINGLVSTKLDLDGIYGSTNALPYGKQCPRFHMFRTNLAEITGGSLKALGIRDLEPPHAVVQFL